MSRYRSLILWDLDTADWWPSVAAGLTLAGVVIFAIV